MKDKLMELDMEFKINEKAIYLIKGDITQSDCEAIVNAAGPSLVLGGGVAGAIARAGGPEIQRECQQIGRIKVGEAVVTTAGRLKARYVIHAVGPKMGEGKEDEKLKKATLNALKRAEEKEIRTLAFPAISTGIFGFPIERCAKIMLETTVTYLKGKTKLSKIYFFLFDEKALKVFESTMRLHFAQLD
jgi:O-acetyl-ADP-ribose deacetylase (regulator of RNase III)